MKRERERELIDRIDTGVEKPNVTSKDYK